MSDGDMVLILPNGRSVGLDLDAARPRLLRLGDANGEDPVPVLRAGRLAGVEHVDGRIHPCRGRTGRPEGALKHAVELPLKLLQWITVRDRHDTPPTWQVSPVGKLVNPSGAMPR